VLRTRPRSTPTSATPSSRTSSMVR
jgi:hypothetical protein